MTNKEVIDLIMARLGGRTSAGLRITAVLELNMKIKELEQAPLRPWFLEDVWSFNTTIGSDTGLPSNFLGESEDGPVFIKLNTEPASAWVELPKTTYTTLMKKTKAAANGKPERYAIYGNTLRYGPLPDAVYNINFPYLKASDPFADDLALVDNRWLVNFPSYIMLEVAMILASVHVQSQEIVQKIAGPLTVAKDNFTKAVQAHENVNMKFLMDDEE